MRIHVQAIVVICFDHLLVRPQGKWFMTGHSFPACLHHCCACAGSFDLETQMHPAPLAAVAAKAAGSCTCCLRTPFNECQC